MSAQAGCSYAAGTRQLTCSSGPLAVGATRTLTFVARATDAAAGTTVQNRATASSTTQDAEPANNVDFAALPVEPRADLRIVKRPADTTLRVDQDVTYTLTATNDGPNDATGVVVTDSVPTGMRFISASPGCIYDAGPPETVTCAVGDLADGASTEITVTLRPRRALAGETVPNDGTVRGDQPDPNLADNSDITSVVVLAQADLQLTKAAAGPTALAGGTLTYTLSLFNEGPSTAPTTTVEDRLPAGVEVRSATPSQGTCTIAAARVTCALGALASGVTAQVLVVVEIPAGAGGSTLANFATVDGGILDPRPQDNEASVSTPVDRALISLPLAPLQPETQALPQPQPAGSAEFAITKTVDRARADTATQLTYTITVTNRGAGAAQQVLVSDTFSDRVTLLSVTATAGTCTRSPLACRIDVIQPADASSSRSAPVRSTLGA